MAGFTITDNDILDNEELNIQEQSLLIALISYYNQEKGYAYPSYKQLMKRSKIRSKTTFINTLNSLIKSKYIKRNTIKGKGCKYYINKFIPSTEVYQVHKCTKYENVPTPSTEMYQHQVQNHTITNTNTNTNTNIKDDFESIWKLYPNKKGKAGARKSVTKLLKKYSKEELKRCVERYSKETQGKEKQYILYGSTFFKDRYEDYLDNNYQESQSNNIQDKKTGEGYAALDHFKGGIEFD